MTPTKLVTTIALLLSLAACANGAGQKQIGGTLLGGALGALAGSQIGSGSGQLAAVALGTLGGAFLGAEVGKSLDRADRLSMQRTVHQALETNQTGATATWNNPDSGHSGTVTPTQTFQTASGQFCREYRQTVMIGGKTESAYGTSCRQADGSWRIQ